MKIKMVNVKFKLAHSTEDLNNKRDAVIYNITS